MAQPWHAAERVKSAWLACVFPLALAACGPIDGAPGLYGRTVFAATRSCQKGCPMSRPLMTGAEETVAVYAASTELTFVSSDESVLRVDHQESGDFGLFWSGEYNYRVDVTALTRGDVELTAQLDGATYDVLPLVIRDAASMAVAESELSTGLPIPVVSDAGVVTWSGLPALLRVDVRDADGEVLLAGDQIGWAVGPPEVAVFRPLHELFLDRPYTPRSTHVGYPALFGVMPGRAVLRAAVGGVATTVSVDVVPPPDGETP